MGMKDSGIEWIGAIPDTWNIKRIKYVANIYTGNSISDDIKGDYEDPEDAFPYIATKDVNAEDSSIDYGNGMYTKKKDHSFRIAKENSTLMCIEGGSAGKKIAKTNQKVTFVNKLCCFEAETINSNYLYMYLKSDAFREEFNQHISGLIGGVSQSEIKGFYILLPSDREQEQIAMFLEEQVSRIDDILGDLNKQLSILEKYKNSLITETIINGLNTDVIMKDSGEDWIKSIPQNYIITKVKYVTTKVTDGAHVTPDTTEENHKFISVTDMDDLGNIDFDNCLEITDEQFAYFIRTGCQPKKRDVLISKDGTIGKTTIINDFEDFVIASSLVIMRPNIRKIDERYLRYNLMSNYVQSQLSTLLVGSALKRVSVYKNANLNIILAPDIQEQRKISDFLDKKCNQIDELIRDKKIQVEKIEQYKKSLIYEFVTGKKRVKGAV